MNLPPLISNVASSPGLLFVPSKRAPVVFVNETSPPSIVNLPPLWIPNISVLLAAAAPVRSIIHSPPVPTTTSEFVPIVTLPPSSSIGAVTERVVVPSALEIDREPALSAGAVETAIALSPVLSMTPAFAAVGTPSVQLPDVLKSPSTLPVHFVSAQTIAGRRSRPNARGRENLPPPSSKRLTIDTGFTIYSFLFSYRLHANTLYEGILPTSAAFCHPTKWWGEKSGEFGRMRIAVGRVSRRRDVSSCRPRCGPRGRSSRPTV